jgi:hypothetical protein
LLAAEPAKAVDQAAEAAPAAEAVPTEATIRQWVKELDADRFETRQRAQSALVEAGYAPASAAMVVTALMDAVNSGGGLELSMRTVNILKELYDSSAPTTRTAAANALNRLAESNNKAVAAKAAAIVRPNGASSSAPAMAGGLALPGPGFIHHGNMQIRFGGFGGQVVEFNAVAGGQRKVHVQENGRAIDIVEDPNKHIRITVTERVGDKDETKTYEAASVDELKQKHPEGFALYEKHLAGQGDGQRLIIGGGANVVIGPGGIQIGPPQVVVDRRREQMAQLSAGLAALEHSVRLLRQQAELGKLPQRDLQPAVDRLEALRRELAEMEKQLRH